MITRCANPACQEELHYLRNGRIIAVDIPAADSIRVEHFWLCGKCSQVLDFDCMQEGHMQLRSKSAPQFPAASAGPQAEAYPPRRAGAAKSA